MRFLILLLVILALPYCTLDTLAENERRAKPHWGQWEEVGDYIQRFESDDTVCHLVAAGLSCYGKLLSPPPR